MNKVFMSGNHTIGEAAIRAGCKCYFGYPITPQNELGEYMAANLRQAGGVFVQSESETAAINMVVGAAATGARVMTSSSSPGISLKQEGLSFLAGFELPAVVVNMMRGGPGLGNIAPAQGDYFQSTRGGGHGDYRTPVLAPASVQELADLTIAAFDLADTYRTPVLVIGDGMMGQMKEPVVFPEPVKTFPEKEWALKGRGDGPSRYLASLILDGLEMERHNWKLVRKYQEIAAREVRYELYMMEDAEFAVVAYGTTARIAKGAIKRARKDGVPVGLIRPITLFPFPDKIMREIAHRIKHFLVFEMSTGQMVEDVKLALNGRAEVAFHGRPGGVIPTPVEFARVINRQYQRNYK
ncbi:MAG: 3-methyl-2-oxobutanoate dehydrogenase subunit VorB [Deltaproteobacteria bacterium]|nr:3-methyl-2-oxobutanoate dehydrogenase subunit VorB [Candidatus Anaeroferrophillus wilburensis]MBN2888345.1 3-methyl-2-oxobutanoate dehydrogenase subunit VorB [Deltaproteobacteria bacterium]